MNYGGVDLTLKDSKGFDVFYLAYSYKRIDMAKILSEFKAYGITLIDINLSELNDG
jgi:hypothetical protein